MTNATKEKCSALSLSLRRKSFSFFMWSWVSLFCSFRYLIVSEFLMFFELIRPVDIPFIMSSYLLWRIVRPSITWSHFSWRSFSASSAVLDLFRAAGHVARKSCVGDGLPANDGWLACQQWLVCQPTVVGLPTNVGWFANGRWQSQVTPSSI